MRCCVVFVSPSDAAAAFPPLRLQDETLKLYLLLHAEAPPLQVCDRTSGNERETNTRVVSHEYKTLIKTHSLILLNDGT